MSGTVAAISQWGIQPRVSSWGCQSAHRKSIDTCYYRKEMERPPTIILATE